MASITLRMTSIPINRLPNQILTALVEEFVTREGTDHGHDEHTLAEKCATVLKQLQDGEAEIVFDAVTETTHIVVVSDSRGR